MAMLLVSLGLGGTESMGGPTLSDPSAGYRVFVGDGLGDVAGARFFVPEAALGTSIKGDSGVIPEARWVTLPEAGGYGLLVRPGDGDQTEITGDGVGDIVSADVDNNQIAVNIGVMGFEFAYPVFQPVSAGLRGLVAVDVDGDGHKDIVTLHAETSQHAWHLEVRAGLGDGSFAYEPFIRAREVNPSVGPTDVVNVGVPQLLLAQEVPGIKPNPKPVPGDEKDPPEIPGDEKDPPELPDEEHEPGGEPLTFGGEPIRCEVTYTADLLQIVQGVLDNDDNFKNHLSTDGNGGKAVQPKNAYQWFSHATTQTKIADRYTTFLSDSETHRWSVNNSNRFRKLVFRGTTRYTKPVRVRASLLAYGPHQVLNRDQVLPNRQLFAGPCGAETAFEIAVDLPTLLAEAVYVPQRRARVRTCSDCD